ncbi:unnamed protein product, partial [Adineta steineri]
MYRPSKATK